MTIEKKQEGGKIVFIIEGRLDTLTSPELQASLIPAFDENPNIELDFSKLAYVSSAGLRVLLLAQKTAAAKSGSFVLCSVSPDIMEIFNMTGFTDILKIR